MTDPTTRWYIEPLSGIPTQEDTFVEDEGVVMVANPMPPGALEITEQEYNVAVGQLEAGVLAFRTPTVEPT